MFIRLIFLTSMRPVSHLSLNGNRADVNCEQQGLMGQM